jgi:cell division transport system permease protein
VSATETAGQRWKPASLLPREPAQDAALVFVTAVLCFFACLAILAAMGAHRAAHGWTTQLTGTATVLVRPSPGESPDAAAARAAEALAGLPGVTEAAALERAKAEALVRPWLGEGVDLSSLPVPRLVTVDLDHAKPATAAALRAALARARVDAEVDDHSRWIGEITRAAAMARFAAICIAVLMSLAAVAVIVFATRAGLAARADVVNVLHLSGAQDRFVAGLFQWRFAALAWVAGVIGAGAAALVAALFKLAGGGQGVVPVLPMVWTDVLFVLPCPFVAAIVASLAARMTALKRLGAIP